MSERSTQSEDVVDPLPQECKIPVGISSCLLGQEVRYNGGHKRSRYCLEVLAECFRLEPFCPEVHIGLGIPREPIRLVGEAGELPQARGTIDQQMDVTDKLEASVDAMLIQQPHLRGYILMKGSPSCGMERVKVYHPNGMPNGSDSGIFARTLMKKAPGLPVEEEARLNDAILRENFIARVFALDDWMRTVEKSPDYHTLLQFHSRQKYLLMAHHYAGYRELGRYLAESHDQPIAEVMAHYRLRFMEHLKHKATRKTHANVLLHLLGYLKKAVDGNDRQELAQLIDDYRQELVPLIVPMTLLKHHFSRLGNEYIDQQTYLNPYPYQLGLRNFI